MKMSQRADDSEPTGFDHGELEQATVVEASAAEADIAAAFLVEVMGEDVAAAFFARFDVVMAEACRRAKALAHMHRAECEPEIELAARQVRRGGAVSGSLSQDDDCRTRALAERIARGEQKASIVVMMRPQDGTSELYEVIAGWNEFRAFVDVLGRTTVPVRISPPIDPDTLTLFDDPAAI